MSTFSSVIQFFLLISLCKLYLRQAFLLKTLRKEEHYLMKQNTFLKYFI